MCVIVPLEFDDMTNAKQETSTRAETNSLTALLAAKTTESKTMRPREIAVAEYGPTANSLLRVDDTN